MSMIVPPGKNKILDTAWTAHKKAQRAETKASKETPADHPPAPRKKMGGKSFAKKRARK